MIAVAHTAIKTAPAAEPTYTKICVLEWGGTVVAGETVGVIVSDCDAVVDNDIEGEGETVGVVEGVADEKHEESRDNAFPGQVMHVEGKAFPQFP